MAAVYLAFDRQLDRLVALKVPHEAPAGNTQLLERFDREARAAANLHHPNICQIFDVGRIEDVPYFTMAYIEGQSLHLLLGPTRPWPQRDAAQLVLTLARALVYAHEQGVVHRDLKPNNILINRQGEPILMDFGLALRVGQPAQRLTVLGELMGTPAYMPPEQVTGEIDNMGPSCDVYSLGVILFELLTGRVPYQGEMMSILAQILSPAQPTLGPLRADVDPALEVLCLRAMAKDQTKRFASMKEFAAALQDYLSDAPTLVPTGSGTSPPQGDIDVELPGAALDVLRTWGWSMGLRKLRIQVQGGPERHRHGSGHVLLDWLGGEDEAADRIMERFKDQPWYCNLRGWALVGKAQNALRDRAYRQAHFLLDQAEAETGPADAPLQAARAHLRGAVCSHEGQTDQALAHLHNALALLERDHFVTGRVLDTLGMVYAGRGNFPMAREFYKQAIRHKEKHDDEPGLALTHGQLGRLHLDWDHLDEAEEHFRADLRLAERLGDQRGEAQMHNHLGQIALTRAEKEGAAGRKVLFRRYCTEAAGWLDSAIRLAQAVHNPVAEAFGRKDRALVHLREGDLAAAEQQLDQAETLFRSARFAEGLALVNRAGGMLRAAQKRYDEAMRKLRSALAHFESSREQAEAARTLWELARTLRDSEAQTPLVARAYLEVLARAEQCRRTHMVAAIEDELREVDPEAYYRHLYRRVRGPADADETPYLGSGSVEVATVLFFELHGFTEALRGKGPEAVLLTFNQMLADLDAVLQRYRAQVVTYLGDGFLAVLRKGGHAERAVWAALDLLKAVREFNRPREILGQPPFQARIAVHTGNVFLGNLGTYRKMNFTAAGPTVGLASRLLTCAEPGCPCLSAATRALLPEGFTFKSDRPRLVTAAGMEPCEVWDVTGSNGQQKEPD
jgi:class 3 adenylate cyclase